MRVNKYIFKLFLYAIFLLKNMSKNKMISPAKFKLVRKQRSAEYWNELEIGKVYEVFNTMMVPPYYGQDMVLSLDSGDHVWAPEPLKTYILNDDSDFEPLFYIRSFRYLGKYQCHAYKP